MIARGFRSVVWVAAIGIAALGCYMLSLRVAAERAELAQLDRRIVAAHQQIRSLQTELGTRGRLQQLEQWNADVLALSAPAANQFIDNQVTLARFDTRTPQIGDAMPVRMASAETAPATVQPQAPVRLASAEIAPAQALLHRASLTAVLPAPTAALVAQAAVARTAVVQPGAGRPSAASPAPRASADPAGRRPGAPVRAAATTPPHATAAPRTAPARAATALLDEGTLSAIGRQARAERRGGARD
jgi:hypothetical protein